MSVPKVIVHERDNRGEEVSLALTYGGTTYDATGFIGDLTITEDWSLGKPTRTLTLVITDPQMVARVTTRGLPEVAS